MYISTYSSLVLDCDMLWWLQADWNMYLHTNLDLQVFRISGSYTAKEQLCFVGQTK